MATSKVFFQRGFASGGSFPRLAHLILFLYFWFCFVCFQKRSKLPNLSHPLATYVLCLTHTIMEISWALIESLLSPMKSHFKKVLLRQLITKPHSSKARHGESWKKWLESLYSQSAKCYHAPPVDYPACPSAVQLLNYFTNWILNCLNTWILDCREVYWSSSIGQLLDQMNTWLL